MLKSLWYALLCYTILQIWFVIRKYLLLQTIAREFGISTIEKPQKFLQLHILFSWME